MEYYSAIKKKKILLCNSMGGPGEHYAKWNKPLGERQISYDFAHMWNLMNWTRTNKENGDRLTDGELMTASDVGEVRGLSRKEKGLMDTDNSVVIARGEGCNRAKR